VTIGWFGWLAPLGQPSSDGRVLDEHGNFTLRPDGVAPLLVGDDLRPAGTVTHVAMTSRATGDYWLVAAGAVSDALTVVRMHRGELHPRLNLESVVLDARVSTPVFTAGLICAVVAGEDPTFERAEFVLSPTPVSRRVATDDDDGVHGIASDDRTGHRWCVRTGQRLPHCAHCKLWMTDWSLVNPCAGSL